MDKVQLITLIALLYAQAIDARAGTVKEKAKENGIKEGELYKLLKEAGYEPNAPQGTDTPSLPNETPPTGNNNGGANEQPPPNNNTPPNSGQEAKKKTVLVSHKTTYENYRCAGLVLTQKPKNFLVTEAQYEKLKRDPWVVVAE